MGRIPIPVKKHKNGGEVWELAESGDKDTKNQVISGVT